MNGGAARPPAEFVAPIAAAMSAGVLVTGALTGDQQTQIVVAAIAAVPATIAAVAALGNRRHLRRRMDRLEDHVDARRVVVHKERGRTTITDEDLGDLDSDRDGNW
jgi:membrane protein implicated in regulation of membrane protease activity